jgi:phospholipid transport system transporter-binding protein
LNLALPAKLDIADASAALPALASAVEQGGSDALVIDASTLKQFDSSAIATLLELRRRAPGREFSVVGAPKSMVELATMYGVAELLAFKS